MLLADLRRLLVLAMLLSITLVASADDAPVYDVDNYPPQFDGQPSTASGGALTQEQRLIRLEQQIKSQQQSGSGARVDTLQTEVQSLRGQVEELTHQLQQVQNQQRTLYSDLDKRLSKQLTGANNTPSPLKTDEDSVAPKPTTAVTASKAVAQLAPAANSKKISSTPIKVKAVASNNQPNVAEEQQIYQTAYDLIKAKKYNEAVTTLQKMLQKYPLGQFAANAHYWLGELYGLLNKNDQSAAEFAAVVKDYPDSSKVADAQLKLGLIYMGQFKYLQAKEAFKKVVLHYPGTASARLASEQLKQLKQAQAQAAR
jgi:tol-pal system protein YbgF